MRQMVVESVLWQGDHGGAVFNGSTEDGKTFRVVASSAVMPRSPVVGESWEVTGVLQRNTAYGEQVVADKVVLLRPSGRLIVKAIAGSRSFPGIGEVKAQALWSHFGEDIYALLDAGDAEPFTEILGAELAAVLFNGWLALHSEAATYQWLDRHGQPVWLARKLLAIYGNAAVAKLEENPYRLLAFTSWKQAEQVARAMGVPSEDERRLVAAADAVCYQRLALAHTWMPEATFAESLEHLLGCDKELALKASNLAHKAFAVANVGVGIQGAGPLSMERFIASQVKEMLAGRFEPAQSSLRAELTPQLLDETCAAFAAKTGLELNNAQREAVAMAVSSPISCIIGGAGVGKTTVLRAVHRAMESMCFGTVHQMALSGRAAKRMSDATGRHATTITGFLNSVINGHINLDDTCLLIVDEASMLDLPYCYRILRCMPPGSRILLVGDSAQLPPIGFGLTFHILAGHSSIPTVELTEIHRQVAATGIPQASIAIRNGEVPALATYEGMADGVSFIVAPPGEIAERLMEVVNDLGGVGACQIIGAVKSRQAGTRTINHLFHVLTATGRAAIHGYAVGEPVIWLVNDYERELFNGSLGMVVEADETLVVEFDGARHVLDVSDIENMEHAYAITVHKSQGSQFERVVVPVYSSRLLDRTLLYTAITRAERQVVLVGDMAAFTNAVIAPPVSSRRETGMAFHLQ